MTLVEPSQAKDQQQALKTFQLLVTVKNLNLHVQSKKLSEIHWPPP